MRRKAKGQTPPTPFAFSLLHFPLARSLFQSRLLWHLKPLKSRSTSTQPSNLKASNSNSLVQQRHNEASEPHAVCLVTASHPPPRPLKVSLPVCDRDTGLISTDAKDLKVSLRISQHSRTTVEEQRRKRREGRGGGDRERPRI